MKKLGFDLIFLGAPASGKDTQARLLANHYELKRVESGEYFRRHIRDKSAFGKTLRRTVGQAKPAPVAVMKIFLTKEIQIAPKKKNLVFVGNPKLPVKEIIKRSFYRMRHDDLRKALIERRINWHKKQVGQTVKYFQALGKLKFINGNQHIFKVTRDIQKTINDYARSQANRTT